MPGKTGEPSAKSRCPEDVALAAYTYARMRLLEAVPFTEERLGMYASLWHETLPKPAVCVYMLDRTDRLIARDIVFCGVARTARDFCPKLPDYLKRNGAVSLAVSGAGLKADDLIRVLLYGRSEHLPLFAVIRTRGLVWSTIKCSYLDAL